MTRSASRHGDRDSVVEGLESSESPMICACNRTHKERMASSMTSAGTKLQDHFWGLHNFGSELAGCLWLQCISPWCQLGQQR